jgi:hypothetical protein
MRKGVITLPNKYNPVQKYKNPIYVDVVPHMFYHNDFIYLLQFTGVYNGDLRMSQYMFLLGAYKSLMYSRHVHVMETFE